MLLLISPKAGIAVFRRCREGSSTSRNLKVIYVGRTAGIPAAPAIPGIAAWYGGLHPMIPDTQFYKSTSRLKLKLASGGGLTKAPSLSGG